MTKKVTYLKDVSFDFEKEDGYAPHLAYTTPASGGAATGLNKPLLLKADTPAITPESLELMKAAKEIRIELSMEEFLRKFMGMYWDDANILAGILGYESYYNESKEVAKEAIESELDGFTLLKSLKTEADFYSLELESQLKVLKVQQDFETALEGTQSEERSLTKNKVPLNNKTLNGDNMPDTLKVEDLVKSVQSLEDALQIEKSAREALEAKEDSRLENAFIKKAKDLGFVEDPEKFGKLLKSMESEGDALEVLEVLEKASEAITKAEGDLFEQASVTGETIVDDEDITKAKTATRKALRAQLGIEGDE